MHTIYTYEDLYEGMKEDKIELQSRIDKALILLDDLNDNCDLSDDDFEYILIIKKVLKGDIK